jgi:hypothetical protein
LGLFSFVSGIIGAGKQKKASRRAEAAQLEYLNKALGQQQQQYDLTRADYAPAQGLLAPSLTQLGDLVGVNGVDAQRLGMEGVQNSPLLASIMKNSEEAILQNASATGGVRGGNVQSSLYDNAGMQFNNELQAQMGRLAGLAGIGMGATDSVANFGQQRANNMGNLYGQQGQVRAGGLLTRGGITAGMWNNAGAFADQVAAAAAGGAGGFGAGGAPFNILKFLNGSGGGVNGSITNMFAKNPNIF